MAAAHDRERPAGDCGPSPAAVEVCNRFEQSWEQGRPLAIETLLAGVPPAERRALLFGLLRREISHRHLRGETVGAAEYEDRFGDDPQLLSALFGSRGELQRVLSRCGYDLLEQIESGRAGNVYRVLRRDQQQLYAVKVVPALLVRHDAHEARHLLDLDYLLHPHISRPAELLDVDGNLLLFNEYVEGMNFAQLVGELGVVPPGAACELAAQVAAGLDQLHSHGRVHGALTPTTMIIATQADAAGVVKLGSVGLTDVADLTMTRFAHSALQSECDWRLFAAPEVADQGDHWDPRCDVYSLGCTLRFLLTGQRPREARCCETTENIRVLWRRAVWDDISARTPPAVREAIDGMMATESGQRPADARAVLELLQPYRDPQVFARLVHQAVDAVQRRQRVTAGVRIAGPAVAPPEEIVAPPAVTPQTTDVKPPQHAPPAHYRRRRRRWIWGAGAAVAAVALLLVLGLVLQRRHADPRVAEVVEYTGPSGVAWFDHLPWYAPAVRLELASWLQSPRPSQRDALVDWVGDLQQRDDPDAQSNVLKTLAQQASDALDGSEQTVVKSLLRCSPESLSERQLLSEYARLARLLDDAETSTGIHLRALLWHAAGDAEQAAADYRRALRMYQDGSSPMQALCASDLARLTFDVPGLGDDPALLLQQAALPAAKSPALQIRLQLAAARYTRLTTADLTAARRLVDEARRQCDVTVRPAVEPLRTEVLEEEAWLTLAQWQPARAQELFQQALQLREAASGSPEADRWRHVVDDVRGLAQAALLLGDQTQAASLVRNLVAATETAPLAMAMIVSPGRARQLDALRPQLLADLGDILLVGPDYNYAEAGACYRQAGYDGPSGTRSALAAVLVPYKLVLASVLRGDLDTARRDLAQAETSYHSAGMDTWQPASWNAAGLSAMPALPRQVWLHRQLAQAAVQVRSADAAAHERALVLLEQLACADAAGPGDVAVSLLAAQFLLEDTQVQPARTARVVTCLAQRVQRCAGESDAPRRRFFQRFARLAHFAGGNAALVLDSDTDASQLSDSIAVLEKAHRVFPAATPLAKPQLSVHSRLHTLAVGITHYAQHSADNPLNLAAAHRDAIALHEAFGLLRRLDDAGQVNRVGVYGPSALSRVLVDQQATRSAILQFIEQLRTIPAADLRQDLVIVSLSGHGLQDLDGSLYFLPYDYQPGSLLSSGLSIDLLQSKLRMLGANVLLILDTCYSGAARNAAEQVVQQRTTDQQVEQALRRMTNSETALAVLVAGKAREKAGESQLFGGHGALTAAVLEFLRQERFPVETKDHVQPVPLHVADQDGLLTLEDLRRYVIDRVAQFPLVQQRPSLYASGERLGDYWCGDIPLRFVTGTDLEPDQESGPPQLGPDSGA